MTKGKLFVLSGPSGAGKGSICRTLLSDDENLRLSVSMTTRKPRSGEIDGEHYYFVDYPAFQELIENDGFLEYANVYGNFYGTPKKQVVEWLKQGHDVILEIDVQGALKVKESYPEGVYIFILPPSLEELERRIQGRGSETEETLKRRLGAACEEIQLIDKYDYCVVNDELDDAGEHVKAIIMSEHCKINGEKVEMIINRYKEES